MEEIRKIIREVIEKSNINLLDRMKLYLIKDKYLFHYTQTEYLEDIMMDGLIPKKYPNSFYSKGIKGIFLTTSHSLYNANLPESLIELMDDYYDNPDNWNEKPLVRLTIDATKLDLNKFTWDDDYILNKYGWNKAVEKQDKIIESLELWRSVAYLDNIPKEYIVGHDFNYEN